MPAAVTLTVSIMPPLATISSDKLYGLLAITNDGQDLIPYPTYRLIPEEICITTTAAMIVASADLDIVCYAKASPRRTLPSWVPEWIGAIPSGTITGANAGRQDLYNAIIISKDGEYLRVAHIGEFLEKGLVLKVRGFIVDMVNGLGAVDLDNNIDIDELTNYGLSQPEPEQNRSQYGSETGIAKALWMSLVLGDRDDQIGGSGFPKLVVCHSSLR